MSEAPDSNPIVRQWVEKAENDLRNAEHTLTLEEKCPFDTVCFHAQQCAEKYLKALLLAADIEPPRTHNLRVLMQLIPPEMPLGLNPQDILILNRYSVEARYPADWDPIIRADFEEVLGIAQRVRAAVRRYLTWVH